VLLNRADSARDFLLLAGGRDTAHKREATMIAIGRTAAVAAARVTRPAVQTQQKRGIIDYLTKYPDTVRPKY